jgi:hypothetical protein
MVCTDAASVTMNETLTALGTLLSGLATVGAIVIAWRVWKGQRLLSQRQLIVPLWDYMSTLNAIDPTTPVIPDIIKAVNTLELVAICVEGEMIDPKVIRRTFRDRFTQLYDQIDSCAVLPSLGKTGKELLRENRAAMSLYDTLRQEFMEQDKIGGH